MTVFLSHASADKDVVDVLKSIFDPDRTSVFYSSDDDPKSRLMGGDSISEKLDREMESSDVVVLIVTMTYLRRPFCLYEACLAKHLWQRRKGHLRLVCVYASDEVGRRFPNEFLPSPDVRTISVDERGAGALLQETLKTAGCDLLADCDARANEFFRRLKNVKFVPGLKFIGMSDVEMTNVWSYVESNGIEAVKSGFQCDRAELEKRLFGGEPIKDLYFASPTGYGFLRVFRDVLRRAIASGANLHVILADKGSDFMLDIAECESLNPRTSFSQDGDIRRHAGEYGSAVEIVNQIRSAAGETGKPDKAIGFVSCLSSGTLLRQTVFLAVGDSGRLWGWMTCMLPPFLNVDHEVPSIVFSGKLGDGGLGNSVFGYCNALRTIAERRKVRESAARGTCCVPSSDVRVFWREKTALAKSNMAKVVACRDAILIEVASQHPLRPDGRPNLEFQARLDRAVELYNDLTSKGNKVRVYVPGSPHVGPGNAEETSLSEAGCHYLREHGLPGDVLFGDEANVKYKGDDGVYNSADECFVAANLFKDGWFGRLLCVCAPNQLLRKTLFYLAFGVVPECHAVTIEDGYHADTMREIFDSLNTVLYVDHDWQDPNGECFKNSRKERRPKTFVRMNPENRHDVSEHLDP